MPAGAARRGPEGGTAGPPIGRSLPPRPEVPDDAGMTDASMTGTTAIALVTGANKGIGKETARQLAAQPGTVVWLAARDEGRGRAAVAELQAADPAADLRFVALDVTDADSIAAAAKTVDAEHGGHLTAAEGARVALQAARLPVDGPTGTYFDITGPIPW